MALLRGLLNPRPRVSAQPPTVGSGGIVTGAGNLSKALSGAGLGFNPNSQIAPPAQAGPAVGVVASRPAKVSTAIAARSSRLGTQR